ncbi:MAG TPA: 1,4-dihydroxy-6-naphthoate synthase, partial [Chitinophagaceae bacterium]|nr:1,4-dihydroxy-6-naphthoate synthase [Chitinophagaceae bacterium]
SILFSRAQYPILSDFVTSHAQEMDADVMRNHIELYVNQYSIEIGEKGMLAVQKMSDILGNHSNSQLFIY